MMHYKPRSDLERIVETINKDPYHKINKKILIKHFKILENKPLVSPKAKNSSNAQGQSYNFDTVPTVHNEKFDYPENSVVTEQGIVNNISRKHKPVHYKKGNFNSDAKLIMDDFHVKTHFKGTAALSLKKIKDK